MGFAMNELDFRALLLLLCLLTLVLSFTLLIGAAWQHHRSGRAAGDNFHSSLVVEIAWTLAPCVIVLLLIWPTVRVFWPP